MRTFYILIVVIMLPLFAIAQKAKDILENGIPIEKDGSIFLRFTNNSIKYYAGEIPKRSLSVKDTLVFLVKNNSINIYLKPLNPLNFNFGSEKELVLDRVEKEESDAMKGILDLNDKLNKSAGRSFTASPCPYDNLEVHVTNIKKLLKIDKKPDVIKYFNQLKGLSFNTEDQTISSLSEIKIKIDEIESHFTSVDNEIKKLRDDITIFNCAGDNPFIIKYVFDQLSRDAENVKNAQYKRLSNLKRSYDLVKKAQIEASEEKDGLRWCIFVDEINTPRGMIALFKLTVYSGGYRLSNENDESIDKDEIIDDKKTAVANVNFKLRRFQRFVPEVSAGIAYTDLSYPAYGLETDVTSNQQKVISTETELIKRLNITGMLNYNYYIQNSPIHPFVQIGAGVNTDFPVLLCGVGLRFNGSGGGRFAIAGGSSFSWIKSLDELKIGSIVSSQNELDNDIKYQFAKPKIYFGIQYNF